MPTSSGKAPVGSCATKHWKSADFVSSGGATVSVMGRGAARMISITAAAGRLVHGSPFAAMIRWPVAFLPNLPLAAACPATPFTMMPRSGPWGFTSIASPRGPAPSVTVYTSAAARVSPPGWWSPPPPAPAPAALLPPPPLPPAAAAAAAAVVAEYASRPAVTRSRARRMTRRFSAELRRKRPAPCGASNTSVAQSATTTVSMSLPPPPPPPPPPPGRSGTSMHLTDAMVSQSSRQMVQPERASTSCSPRSSLLLSTCSTRPTVAGSAYRIDWPGGTAGAEEPLPGTTVGGGSATTETGRSARNAGDDGRMSAAKRRRVGRAARRSAARASR